MRPLLRKLHRWAGLSVGVWAALTGLTGSLLVFSDDIDRLLNPSLLQVTPASHTAPIDTTLTDIQQRFPNQALLTLKLPQSATEPLMVRLSGEPVTEVFIEPSTAEVLGTRPYLSGIMGWLWDFHAHLLAEDLGETVVGILGLALLGLVITGVVLWWPRRGRTRAAFRILWHATTTRRFYDLHRVGGILSTPLLLISVATGCMLVFHTITTDALTTSLGGEDLALPASITVPENTKSLPASQLLAAATEALPKAKLISMKFPKQADAPAVVRLRFAENTHPNGRSFVAVNPYTAEVLQVHDWRAAGLGLRAADYKYPLHIGSAFGLPGRIMVLITGLIPAALLFTGAWVWWRRSKPRLPKKKTPQL